VDAVGVLLDFGSAVAAGGGIAIARSAGGAQSNVTLAPRLQGKLLLMVGETDRNVDPASTLQVADALIKADKDFELLVIPGAGLGVMG